MATGEEGNMMAGPPMAGPPMAGPPMNPSYQQQQPQDNVQMIQKVINIVMKIVLIKQFIFHVLIHE